MPRNYENMNESIQINKQSLIVAWALAECGIGGVMHALRIPFTGIVVGGIAVTCIALIAMSSLNVRKEILTALTLVLLIKLAVSPHSPWQAYVAVMFQGVLGSVLLRNDLISKWRILIFTVICLAESALQKIAISVLIFGLEFFKAIDLVLNSITSFFGVISQGTYSIYLLSIYLVLHLMVGIILGLYIPKIPLQLKEFEPILSQASKYRSNYSMNKNNPKGYVQMIYVILVCALLLIFHLYLPPKFIWVNIFVRALVVTVFMAFVGGPIFKYFIKLRLAKSKSSNHSAMAAQEIIDKMPAYKSMLLNKWSFIRIHYKGLLRIKLLLLSAISLLEIDDNLYESKSNSLEK